MLFAHIALTQAGPQELAVAPILVPQCQPSLVQTLTAMLLLTCMMIHSDNCVMSHVSALCCQEQLAERFGQARPEAAKPAPAKKPPKPKASPRIMLRYDMSVKQLAGNLGTSAPLPILYQPAVHRPLHIVMVDAAGIPSSCSGPSYYMSLYHTSISSANTLVMG